MVATVVKYLCVKLSQEVHDKMMSSEDTMLMTARIL